MKVIATYKSWAEVEGVAGVVAGDVCIEHLFASIRVVVDAFGEGRYIAPMYLSGWTISILSDSDSGTVHSLRLI